jgi:hypothetical protein
LEAVFFYLGDLRKISMVVGCANRLKAKAKSGLKSSDYFPAWVLGDFREIIKVLGFANRLKANAESHLNSPDYFSALALYVN